MTNLSEISAFCALAQGAACQVMSRDLYRLCKALPIDRQLSTMHGAFGFYLINAVTMHLVQFTAIPSRASKSVWPAALLLGNPRHAE